MTSTERSAIAARRRRTLARLLAVEPSKPMTLAEVTAAATDKILKVSGVGEGLAGYSPNGRAS